MKKTIRLITLTGEEIEKHSWSHLKSLFGSWLESSDEDKQLEESGAGPIFDVRKELPHDETRDSFEVYARHVPGCVRALERHCLSLPHRHVPG